MWVVCGSGIQAGRTVSGGIAGSALFSPTSLITKPSFLVRRFPDSALGREWQKSLFFFFFLTAEEKFRSASLRFDGCFPSFSLKASLNR